MQIGSQMSSMAGQMMDASKISSRIMQDLDTDESGGISTSELEDAGKFGEMLATADTDGDGVVSEDELSAKVSDDMENGNMPPPPPPMDAESMTQNLLNELDTDGSGDISAEELAAVENEDMASKLAESDTDGDGIITQDELSAQIAQEMENRGDMPPPMMGGGMQDMSLNSFKDLLTSLNENGEEEDVSAIDQIKNYLSQLNLDDEQTDNFLKMLETNRFDVSA